MPAKISILTKKKICKLLLLSTLCFSSVSTMALIDYSESDDFKPKSSGASRPTAQNVTKGRAPSSPSKSRNSKYHFLANVNYGSQNLNLVDKNGKVDTLEIEALLETSYNIFAKASYYESSSSDKSIVSGSTRFQRGNPELILGFNWLEFGGASDRASLDLYGGLRFSQKKSDFASTRTDKIAGVSTAKRFANFALGLGYEVHLTGESLGREMAIGNISKISASLGWVVSNDISFLLEGFTYQVKAGDSAAGVLSLTEDLKFSTIKPQLHLKLSPMINLTLGASIRTRRLKNSTLTAAKLWSLEGAYGRSLFAGLSVSI